MSSIESIRYEKGWLGAFSREQAEGAYPNGTRVVKCVEQPGDAHRLGDKGTVLGSLDLPVDRTIGSTPDNHIAYFVEWDDCPNVAVGVMQRKITKEETDGQ